MWSFLLRVLALFYYVFYLVLDFNLFLTWYGWIVATDQVCNFGRVLFPFFVLLLISSTIVWAYVTTFLYAFIWSMKMLLPSIWISTLHSFITCCLPIFVSGMRDIYIRNVYFQLVKFSYFWQWRNRHESTGAYKERSCQIYSASIPQPFPAPGLMHSCVILIIQDHSQSERN